MRKLIFVLAGFSTFLFGVVSFNFVVILKDSRILLEPSIGFREDLCNIPLPEPAPALAQEEEVLDYSSSTYTFPESGYYALLNPPKEFRGFEFNLGYGLDSPGAAEPHSLWVSDGRRRFFEKGNVIKIDGKKIFFKTIAINGVKYTFEGNFTERSFSISEYDVEYNVVAVLRGTLTRFLNGKKVSAARVGFLFYGLGC